MIENKNILAIVPARKGSKRLRNKNLKKIKGKPLISWTIEDAKKSKYIDEILVTTDSVDIINLSKKLNVNAPFIRPKFLSNDTSNTSDVIIHSLKWLKNNLKKEFDFFILLQPTSPLRNYNIIDKAIENFFNNQSYDYLISVSKFHDMSKVKFSLIDKGFSFNKNLDDYSNVFINGAVYIAKTNVFLSQKFFNYKKTIGYLMNAIQGIDIDTIEDFNLASKYL